MVIGAADLARIGGIPTLGRVVFSMTATPSANEPSIKTAGY
jgi:hypothetical protein